MTERIEIPLSKKKVLRLLLGALLFVLIGLWFVISPPRIRNSFFGNPVLIKITGYASVIFFGLCLFFYTIRLFSNEPGLILDTEGFTDNSSALTVGKILWSDVKYISVETVQRQRFIAVELNNPEHYIQRQTNGFKRALLTLNSKMSTTPININPNGFQMTFNELYSTVRTKFENRQGRSTNT